MDALFVIAICGLMINGSSLSLRNTMKRIIILFLPLVAFALAVIWLRPFNDDFCSMFLRGAHGGIIRGTIYQYSTWTGRYSATFIELLFNGYAPLFPLFMIAIWVASLYCIINRLLHSRQLAVASAIVIVLATLSIAPAFYESYLWQQGSTTYLAALVGYTVVFALAPVSIPLAVLIAFISAGFSDIASLLGTLMLFAAVVITRDRRWILIALSSLVGLIIVIAAPGNAFRQATVPASDLVWSLRTSLLTVSYFFRYSLGIHATVIILAFLVGCHKPYSKAPRWFAVLPIGVIAGVMLMWFTGFYLTSTIIVPRVWVVPQYFMLAISALWAYLLGSKIRFRLRYAVPITTLVVAFIWIAAISNIVPALAYTRDYATLYDSGRLLYSAEGWVIGCAKYYYPAETLTF